MRLGLGGNNSLHVRIHLALVCIYVEIGSDSHADIMLRSCDGGGMILAGSEQRRIIRHDPLVVAISLQPSASHGKRAKASSSSDRSSMLHRP